MLYLQSALIRVHLRVHCTRFTASDADGFVFFFLNQIRRDFGRIHFQHFLDNRQTQAMFFVDVGDFLAFGIDGVALAFFITGY